MTKPRWDPIPLQRLLSIYLRIIILTSRTTKQILETFLILIIACVTYEIIYRPSCIFRWDLSIHWRAKCFPHNSQWNGFSPARTINKYFPYSFREMNERMNCSSVYRHLSSNPEEPSAHNTKKWALWFCCQQVYSLGLRSILKNARLASFDHWNAHPAPTPVG